MKVRNSYFGKYFIKSVIHLLKSKILFFIVSLIENIELLICLILFEEVFFYFNKNYFETKTYLKNILLEASPYSNYFDFQKKSDAIGFDSN